MSARYVQRCVPADHRGFIGGPIGLFGDQVVHAPVTRVGHGRFIPRHQLFRARGGGEHLQVGERPRRLGHHLFEQVDEVVSKP